MLCVRQTSAPRPWRGTRGADGKVQTDGSFHSPFQEKSFLQSGQSLSSFVVCSPSTTANHIQLNLSALKNNMDQKGAYTQQDCVEDLLNADSSRLDASCSRVLEPIYPVHFFALFIQLCSQASLAGPLRNLNDLNSLLLTHFLDLY